MKRNKLNTPSLGQRLFSDSAVKNKLHNFLFFSTLTAILVFITTIVLATSQPESSHLESVILDLPDLPSSEQTEIPAPIQTAAIEPDMDTKSLPHPDINATSLHNTSTTSIVSQDNTKIHSAPNTTVSDDSPSAQTDSAVDPLQEQTFSWQEITVKKGDNLSLIFPRVGLTARDVYQVSKLGKKIAPLLHLKPGQKLRFHILQEGDTRKLSQLQLIVSPIKTLEVFAKNDRYGARTLLRAYEKHQSIASGTIENSLFEAGLKAGLSNKLVMELAYIFGWDIDFALDLRKGDQFKVLYTENFLDGQKISDGDIQAAEFINHGQTYRAIRYTNKQGESHYYTPEGASMRKAFMRTPVNFTRISSRFSLGRKHPILNRIRAHKGVDYAAPKGTPIKATGDGKITFLGWKGGYGRVIIISHAGRYSTLYGHMLRFKKGLRRGKRVKQGDIIGYVGMSGLATGPHLHYEFRINGVHHNPLTVKLPKAQSLPKRYLADFKKQAQPLLAQLDAASTSTAVASK